MAVLRTSEFWVGLVAAILQFLVSNGHIPQGASDFINGAMVYIFGRLVSKAAKAVPTGGAK